MIHVPKVQKQAELIYAVGTQAVGYLWEGSDWSGYTGEGILAAVNALCKYTGVLTWQKFIRPYIHDFCTFLYLYITSILFNKKFTGR